MALKWRKDSVAELRKQKSKKELQAENEALQQKVTSLEAQMTSTQVACAKCMNRSLLPVKRGVTYGESVRRPHPEGGQDH